MRIGLDIDNVITDFDKKILKEFYKEDKNKRNNGIINPEGNWIKNQFDWTENEVEDFFNKNMESFAKELEPRKNAKYYMDKLLEDNHSLYLISHRAYPHYTKPYEVTKKWLKDNDINYTKLILSETTNKSKECIENNIDIMFDDVRLNCRQIQDSGIKCYLMATDYNLKNIDGLNIVNDWKELYEVIRNMEKKKIILDTDMYNEVDDQFALTYIMNSLDVFDIEAITIAPFLGSGYANTKTIEEGTEKSYETTLKILDMLDMKKYKEKVYKGALKYFYESKETNPAVEKIIEIAKKNEHTTILAIGAITNIALAINKCPEIIPKIKVVWLGGNTFLTKNNNIELNFRQDVEAVCCVFNSKVELVVIPCRNVAANLVMTTYELEHYLKKDTELNKYLRKVFRNCKKTFFKNDKEEIGQSKTIWDISVIAYEINKNWFLTEEISCPNILDNGQYEQTTNRHKITFVNDLFRNKIYKDYFTKMGYNQKEEE